MSDGSPPNGLQGHLLEHASLGVTDMLRDHESRLREMESIIDQLRGAKALIYFLIGSNLLAVLAVAWGVFK